MGLTFSNIYFSPTGAFCHTAVHKTGALPQNHGCVTTNQHLALLAKRNGTQRMHALVKLF